MVISTASSSSAQAMAHFAVLDDDLLPVEGGLDAHLSAGQVAERKVL